MCMQKPHELPRGIFFNPPINRNGAILGRYILLPYHVVSSAGFKAKSTVSITINTANLFDVAEPSCYKEPNCELILPAGRVQDASDPRVVSDDCTDHWVHLQNICYDGKSPITDRFCLHFR